MLPPWSGFLPQHEGRRLQRLQSEVVVAAQPSDVQSPRRPTGNVQGATEGARPRECPAQSSLRGMPSRALYCGAAGGAREAAESARRLTGARPAAPQVPLQLRDAFLQAISDGRVRSMQNKCMPAAPLHRPGALLLGALACVVPHRKARNLVCRPGWSGQLRSAGLCSRWVLEVQMPTEAAVHVSLERPCRQLRPGGLTARAGQLCCGSLSCQCSGAVAASCCCASIGRHTAAPHPDILCATRGRGTAHNSNRHGDRQADDGTLTCRGGARHKTAR